MGFKSESVSNAVRVERDNERGTEGQRDRGTERDSRADREREGGNRGEGTEGDKE